MLSCYHTSNSRDAEHTDILWQQQNLISHCDKMSVWSNVGDKLWHDSMLWPRLGKHSDSILHPQCCTSAKVSFLVCMRSIFLVINKSHSCQNKLQIFCYISSRVVFKLQRKPLPKLMRKAFELYFGYKVGDQDQVWVPSICGVSCSRTLASDG